MDSEKLLVCVEKPLVCVVHLGGSLVSDKDGSLSYTGGEAHLTDVDRETTFERFKSEIAEMYGGEISGLAFKYALPSNKRTLITISNDKDLRRMVDINRNNSSPEIYVLAKGSGPLVLVNETKNIPSRYRSILADLVGTGSTQVNIFVMYVEHFYAGQVLIL